MTASVPPGATNTARSVTVDGSDHSGPHRATGGENVRYRKGDIVRITLGGETAKCRILGVIPDSRNSLGLNFEFERLTPWVPAHPSIQETSP